MPEAALKRSGILQDVTTSTGALILSMARTLVDQPNRVVLATVAKGETILFVLTVTARDLDKIIGFQGRTVQSIRTILDAVSKRNGQRFQLDVEPEQPTP